MAQLHPETFQGVTFGYNRILDMWQNKFEDLPPKVFGGLELNRLYLQNNNLVRLHAGTLQGLTFGKNGILNMSQNKLQVLHAETFQGLSFANKGILDMSHNELVHASG